MEEESEDFEYGKGSANHVLHDKFGQLPVSVNTVLLEHTTPIHLSVAYGCFQATTAELNSCGRGHLAP